jgi:tetratricopeptide (TPR) repeat protein
MEERFHWGYFFMGLALNAMGEQHDAIKHLRKAFQFSGHSTVMLSALGHVYGAARMYDAARGVLRTLCELLGSRYVSSYEIALIHVGLGEHDRALDFLDAAVEERSGWLPYILNDVRLDPIRSIPRFAGLTAQVGLQIVRDDTERGPRT